MLEGERERETRSTNVGLSRPGCPKAEVANEQGKNEQRYNVT